MSPLPPTRVGGRAALEQTTIVPATGASQPPPTACAAVLDPGTAVDRYRIGPLLGRGGMSVVYEAEHETLGRAVALKLMCPTLAGDPIFETRFRREALHQAALDHPHVVGVYDAGVSDSGLFIAMQLIRGETLRHRIQRGPAGIAETIRLLAPVADALDAAHARGLVHRDVKPQNILLASSGTVYLADFGLVRAVRAGSVTDTGLLLGTPHYMAPEQMLGRPVSAAADVYSLAAIAYECLTGRLAWTRDDRDDMPSEAAAVLEQALSPSPEQRPASAGALIHALRRARERRPCAMRRPGRQRARALADDRTPRRRRHRMSHAPIVSSFAIGALGVWGGVSLDGRGNDPMPLVTLSRPTVTISTHHDFLRERRLSAEVVRSGQGIAIDTNVVIEHASRPLLITCSLRDLTTRRMVVQEVGSLEPGRADRVTSTVSCWVPAVIRTRHRYRTTVRVSDGSASPLASRSRDLLAFRADRVQAPAGAATAPSPPVVPPRLMPAVHA